MVLCLPLKSTWIKNFFQNNLKRKVYLRLLISTFLPMISKKLKQVLTFCLLIIFQQTLSAQDSSSTTKDTTNFPHGKYPYVLPIWGQKAQDRGMGDRLQLPFGISAMYVNSSMQVEVTDFSMTIGNNPDLNEILQNIISTETLNFTSTVATVNGINLRGDVWVLPFLNVYGMYSQVTGGTTVSLQPTWTRDNGEIIQLDQINSSVEFTAKSLGLGSTFAYGYKTFFVSGDANYTWNRSELLDKTLGLLTGSGRVGKAFRINDKIKLSAYIGAMYRNFTDNGPSSGRIKLNEALPDLQKSVNNGLDQRIYENTVKIDDNNFTISQNNDKIIDLQDQIDNTINPIEKQKLEIRKSAIESWNVILETSNERISNRNDFIDGKQTEMNESGVYETEINYSIKKELIYPWTFQFGFNLELNKHLMIRGEYGVSQYQRLLLTGINYRFGVKKK